MNNQQRGMCKDKKGRVYRLGFCSACELEDIKLMYDRFAPTPASQGLPPQDDGARREWIKQLLRYGQSLAIWDGSRIIAHASLTPDLKNIEAEYIIFVDKTHRNQGLGTHLTALAVKKAGEMGLTRLWLEVEALNFPAIKLYRKFGFQFCGGYDCGRKMILEMVGG